MPTFSYNTGIPAGPNNPSNDQPLMQTNTNSINSIIGVDHFSFGTGKDGWHQQSTYPNLSSNPTTIAGQVATYSKQGSVTSELFMIRDGVVGTETTLTTSKIGVPVVNASGYTFLPGASIANGGGLLMQWGTVALNAAGAYTTVTGLIFPNNCYNIQITMINNQGTAPSANGVFVTSGSVSKSGFQITNTSSSAAQSAYWLAIGN